jgi:hypothetical protein
MEFKIYKVKYFISQYNKTSHVTIEQEDSVIIDNLNSAITVFKRYKAQVDCRVSFKKNCKGFVQLFVPSIYENGFVSNVPEKDEYIMKYTTL